MDNQMQAQPENIQSAVPPESQNSYGYFDAFGDAFQRILKNKIFWIWGIFLAGGGGSFSRIGNSPEIEEGTAQAEFLAEFLWLIPVLIGVGIVVGIGFWIFSTIVRPGVIRALDRLQNNSNSKVRHGDIWGQGRDKFVSVIKLDLVVILIGLGFSIVGGILAAILIGIGFQFQESIGVIILLISLGVVFLAIFLFAFIIIGIIRMLGTVFISLGDMNWSIVIKTSYQLIKNNKKETVKLLLINMLISMISGMVAMIVIGITALVLVGISIAAIFAFKPVGILIAVISAVIIIALVLFLKSFISLWSQDVVIWWVKKMQGVNIEKEKLDQESIVTKDDLTDESSEESESIPQGELVMESEK